MLADLAVLNYRYRLWPTPQQERALTESMAIARRAWNSMVSLRQHALDQCRRGREASIRNALIELEAAKKPVGMRAAKLKRLAEEKSGDPLQLLFRAEIEDRERRAANPDFFGAGGLHPRASGRSALARAQSSAGARPSLGRLN